MTKKLLTLAGYGLIALGSAQAATLFDSPSVANRNDFTGTVGTQFTVGAQDLSVTHLGFQDADLDGLATSHEVGIWDTGGTLIASTTVQAGTASSLIGSWRYEALGSSVTLLAGSSYSIGAFVTNGGDAWTDTTSAAGVSASASIASVTNTFANTSFTRPTLAGGGNSLRWAPANASFTVAAVPEPSSTALLGLGGLSLLLRRRR